MIRDDDAEVLERAPVGVVAFANQSNERGILDRCVRP
jgi:hypothetical protein